MSDHPVIPWLTEPRRAWLYRVVLAVLSIGVVLGALDVADMPAAVELIGAILAVGTAAAHTSTKV